MQTPILGSAYVARSVNAAANRMVNLFPEAIPEGGFMPAFLNRAPGLLFQQEIGTGPIRGLWAPQTVGENFYVVSGEEVYKLTGLTSAPTLLGTVTGTGQVSIADNGTQIFFACNPDSFIYDEDLDVFTQITDPDFPGAVTVAYLDGYFVFNEPDSQRIWVTEIFDGSLVDPLDFASAEGSPDGVVGILVDHRECWVFGTNSTEVWYNAGGIDFPLAPIQGAFNEIGCIAANSIAKLDNTVFWLGADARGQGIIYRAAGYTAQRISTHAIEWRIQSYLDMTDAVAYTYQQDGHAFYVISFPSADETWVYDVSTNAWHQRSSYSAIAPTEGAFEAESFYSDAFYTVQPITPSGVSGVFSRHRSNCQCNYQGNIVVGDYVNGNVYTFELDVFEDNGIAQRWLRAWRALPTGQNNLQRTAHHSLQLECESGVGLVTDQGDDPQAMLRWSDDGGHTWSNEHWAAMGPIGATSTRVIWRRLGMTLKLRDRVYEVSGSDPVRIYLTGAELLLTGTNG
tara:strand:+ start:253 stop:1785 length:1533 start_codon:yes stop_codon:yes gene_type:complete